MFLCLTFQKTSTLLSQTAAPSYPRPTMSQGLTFSTSLPTVAIPLTPPLIKAIPGKCEVDCGLGLYLPLTNGVLPCASAICEWDQARPSWGLYFDGYLLFQCEVLAPNLSIGNKPNIHQEMSRPTTVQLASEVLFSTKKPRALTCKNHA